MIGYTTGWNRLEVPIHWSFSKYQHNSYMIVAITLVRFITLLCGIDNIIWNISSFKLNMRNIPHIMLFPYNIVMDGMGVAT